MPKRIEDVGRESGVSGQRHSDRDRLVSAVRGAAAFLEPPRVFDSDLLPTDGCAVLESMLRDLVIQVFVPPEGVTWPYVDGIAGFERPEIAVRSWAGFLTGIVASATESARDRDLSAIGIALSYAIRDLRGFGHSWMAQGGDDWTDAPDDDGVPASAAEAPPRRGMYAAHPRRDLHGSGGFLELGLVLERLSEEPAISADVRAVVQQALLGIPILDLPRFGRSCGRAIGRYRFRGHAAGEAVPRAARSNEFDITKDGRHFLLAGNDLCWFQGPAADKERRHVTVRGKEGRLLAALLLRRNVPVDVGSVAVSHLRAALRRTRFRLDGRGENLRLVPFCGLSQFARSVLTADR